MANRNPSKTRCETVTYDHAKEAVVNKVPGGQADRANPSESGARPEGESVLADPSRVAKLVQEILSIAPDYSVFPDSFVYFKYLINGDYLANTCYNLNHILWLINLKNICSILSDIISESDDSDVSDEACYELGHLFSLSIGCKYNLELGDSMAHDVRTLIKCGYSPAHLVMCLMTPCPEALRTKTWKPEFEYLMARVAVRLGPLVDATSKT